MVDVVRKLAGLGLELPKPAAPVANYVPWVVSGTTLFVSGQLSVGPQGLIKGCLGRDLGIEDGARAAQACGLYLLAQAGLALGGDFSRLARCLRLGGFVASTPDFFDQPKVMNGASDLMVAVLGDAGRHARAAVGVPSLPLGAAVEVDGIFEIAA